MMRSVDLRESFIDPKALVPRADLDVQAATVAVREIIADVAARGADAVLDWAERLDGVRPPSLRVPRARLTEALAALDSDVRGALDEAIRRVRLVHDEQQRADVTTVVAPGGTVTERWTPVDRVGLYVPGGRAVYPSSVVMNVVPAQIAGVPSLAVASPPQQDFGGLPHPLVLAACELLGVEEVYAAGGAAAVALFAYGAELPDGACDPVAMVTGPGNIWVTAAKRELRGRIAIDSEAGPTEIMIVADESADPRFVAADLISQAEHDVIAAAVLVTDSERLAADVLVELETQVNATKHQERIREALAGPQSAVILVRDVNQAIQVANSYAAEHLEIQTRSARDDAKRVRNAGAIFIGPWSPVSLGDYCAGSNHVLPTGGCACYSSGLSVQTFLKGVHVIEYDSRALAQVADSVGILARAEDLPAHAAAVDVRVTDG